MASPDDFFTPEAAQALEAKLRGLGKDVALTIHEAGHAFMNEEDPGRCLRRKARKAALARSHRVLHDQLG